jgi:hypothetical protein
MRHPNYLVVAIERALVPLALGLPAMALEKPVDVNQERRSLFHLFIAVANLADAVAYQQEISNEQASSVGDRREKIEYGWSFNENRTHCF